ncbi:TonB-dependent receptor, partial [Xanthomonas oryzae pv. oryzae]
MPVHHTGRSASRPARRTPVREVL